MNSFFRKGEIFYADLGERDTHIQHGRRPVVVLGNNAANIYSEVVTVIPITSKRHKAAKIPTHVTLSNSLREDSVILPEQIVTIPKSRIYGPRLYKLTPAEMVTLSNALKWQLGLA